MKKIYSIISFLCLFGWGSVHAQGGAGSQQKTGIQVTDLLLIKDVGSIVMSPTGDYALYSVRSVVDGDKKWEHNYHTQWFIVRFDGENTTTRPFTNGGMATPVISPDGKKILLSRPVSGKSQLFVWHMDGGEPVQLTNFKYGASGGRWSPDGKHIVFSASFNMANFIDDKDQNPNNELPLYDTEKPGFDTNDHLRAKKAKVDPNGSLEEIRAYLALNERDRKAKVINKLRFQGERSVNADSYNVSHLFVVDAEGKTEPKQLTRGFNSYSGAQFKGPDSIYFSGRKESTNSLERDQISEVYAMAIDGSGFRVVSSEEGFSTRFIAFSKDGNHYAYIKSERDTWELPVVNIVSNGKLVYKIDLDRSVSGFSFDDAAKNAYFTVQRNGGTVLYHLNLGNKKLTKLTSDDVGINAFAFNNSHVIYSQTDITNPSELYMADLQMKNPKRLTDLNTGWLANRKLTGVEKGTFKNEKGLEVEYWIMKPTDYQEGKKYPLMLQIHGGPASMWGPGVMSMWHEYQYFASQGYGIVYANPRGSSGYGMEFVKGNYRDWGNGPMSDVLTAVDKAVAQGWVDEKKMVVTGGSYAGYLTNWIIAHDHRFAAASSQRGVYHLTTFYGEGNASSLVPRYYGGYPWEPEVRKIMEEQSPYNYVDKIQTPYLIFHGEVDLRTGVIQSEMLYKSLKQLGKEVEYVRHPNADHELTRSGDNRQRIDQMLRIYEFFARYIK